MFNLRIICGIGTVLVCMLYGFLKMPLWYPARVLGFAYEKVTLPCLHVLLHRGALPHIDTR